MKELNKHLRTSALVMKLMGWGMIVGGPVAFLAVHARESSTEPRYKAQQGDSK